jgi:hypothetical protein
MGDQYGNGAMAAAFRAASEVGRPMKEAKSERRRVHGGEEQTGGRTFEGRVRRHRAAHARQRGERRKGRWLRESGGVHFSAFNKKVAEVAEELGEPEKQGWERPDSSLVVSATGRLSAVLGMWITHGKGVWNGE